MCKVTEDRTRAALGVVNEFVAVVSKVQHEELAAASAQLALEGLVLLEEHGRKCVQFLLGALEKAGGCGSVAVHDAVWMLQRITQKSDLMRSWIVEADGVGVVHRAMITNAHDARLLKLGPWLAYNLDGLNGLAGLLCRSRGSTCPCHVEVRAASAWAIYKLIVIERSEYSTSQTQPESASVLGVLVDAMAHETTSPDVLWACCAAADAMIKDEPRMGALFMEKGGIPLLTRTLRMAGCEGQEDFRRAVAYLITSLAQGHSHAVNMLRAEGIVGTLMEVGLNGKDADVEAVVWALGCLGGIQPVLESMAGAGAAKPSVIRGGINAICECAWNAVGDHGELARLPQALTMLLDVVKRRRNGDQVCMQFPQMEIVHALGCVLSALAPHAPPGQVNIMDGGVEALLDELKQGAAAGADHPDINVENRFSIDGKKKKKKRNTTAGVAAEAIGRVALVSPAWREGLRRCGTLDVLAVFSRSFSDSRLLQKYLFWAGAAIAGLPFVATEMRLRMDSVDVVDAGLCTIIDILDDDIDGEYALVGVERCSNDDVLRLLGLVLELMTSHAGMQEVQDRGCRCVELLVPLIPVPLPSPQAALAPVLAAARRFSRRHNVISGACGALRALCSLALGQAACGNRVLASAIQENGVSDCVEQVLQSYGEESGECASSSSLDLLEDASAVLALTGDVEAVVQRVVDSPPASLMREAGLKALFEVGRGHLHLLGGPVAKIAAEACNQIAAEESSGGGGGGGRVEQLASLLFGLCGHSAAPCGGA